MKTLPLTLCAVLALSACDTMNSAPVANGERTQSGAIIGGMIGALAGAASSDNDQLERAVIGGALGAAAGAGIGQMLDRQARDLEASIGNDRVKIVNTGSELVVTMPQDILFATDSATLRPDLQSDLRALAANLQQYPNTTVDVIGHTDSTGEAGYNQELSTRRAGAVSAVLFSQGVSSARVRSYGRGEDLPIATNLTEDGKRQNRRVEIIIRPNA